MDDNAYQDAKSDDSPLDPNQVLCPPALIPVDSAAPTTAGAHANGDDPSVKTLSDSGVGLESDGLENMVHRLQSEVADSRAVVFELENRLCVAESSNRHIVDELKILLADAEGTLVGSDESDSEESVAVSSKHGSTSDEDSNIVYNRICNALESLITEAQTALERTSNTPLSTSPLPTTRRPCRHQPQRLRIPQGQRQLLQLPSASTPDLPSTLMDDGESSQVDTCSHSSCGGGGVSRRSSIIPLRTDRSLSISSAVSHVSSSRLQAHSGKDTFSRMVWKEKQREQYERYRRSCDRISLELELLLDDTLVDQYDLQEAYFSPSIVHSRSNSSSSGMRSTHPTTTSPSSPSQPQPPEATPSSGTHSARRRGTGSKAERMQRSYQLQLLNPQARARQLRRRHGSNHDFSSMHSHQPSTSSQSTSSSQRSSRQYKSQGVGGSRSQSIVMQLYGLWKHTWLRKRIMKVIAESLELMLILWVVLKLSETSLAWMGIQMSKGGPRAWLTYIYGERQGAGAAAKELYEKIRRDGLRLQQIRFKMQREREVLMQEFSASEAALGMAGTPFTPKGMVLAPAKRLLEHAVSGLVLSYLSDNARRIARAL
ncbi:hypothetical protein BGX31_010352 [Mortierella sp. GBA43]|nr:hypothetical protein BGX31_010352 [Mortierella sp. GBA43]